MEKKIKAQTCLGTKKEEGDEYLYNKCEYILGPLPVNLQINFENIHVKASSFKLQHLTSIRKIRFSYYLHSWHS